MSSNKEFLKFFRLLKLYREYIRLEDMLVNGAFFSDEAAEAAANLSEDTKDAILDILKEN